MKLRGEDSFVNLVNFYEVDVTEAAQHEAKVVGSNEIDPDSQPNF